MLEISVVELAAQLQDTEKKPRLLDVREPWEFAICHIDDSELQPMRSIPSIADQLDRTEETIVICHHGIRSRQVVLYLESLGFSNMVNLRGGLAAWANEVDRQMPTY